MLVLGNGLMLLDPVFTITRWTQSSIDLGRLGNLPVSTEVTPPSVMARKYKVISWANQKTRLTYFPSLENHFLCYLILDVLKTVVSCILLSFCCFGWEVKSCVSTWARNRSLQMDLLSIFSLVIHEHDASLHLFRPCLLFPRKYSFSFQCRGLPVLFWSYSWYLIF